MLVDKFSFIHKVLKQRIASSRETSRVVICPRCDLPTPRRRCTQTGVKRNQLSRTSMRQITFNSSMSIRWSHRKTRFLLQLAVFQLCAWIRLHQIFLNYAHNEYCLEIIFAASKKFFELPFSYRWPNSRIHSCATSSSDEALCDYQNCVLCLTFSSRFSRVQGVPVSRMLSIAELWRHKNHRLKL